MSKKSFISKSRGPPMLSELGTHGVLSLATFNSKKEKNIKFINYIFSFYTLKIDAF
jgi:hypothetical protein